MTTADRDTGGASAGAVEFWELMLAVMKLGSMAMPTATAVGTDDLVDRMARTGAAHVIGDADDTSTLRWCAARTPD